MAAPSPEQKFPLTHTKRLCFLKNIIKNPNIQVGDFTYYDDFESVDNFEKNVKYHFDFVGDKLIIGKFCMIASGVTFIMNGANHLQNSLTTFPFAIFGEDWKNAMEGKEYSFKGDTIIGNDVWIGYDATIMPGVTVGDGAIIGSKSVVTKNVESYSVVGGNPAKEIHKRFSDDRIKELLEMKWWNWPKERISKELEFLMESPNRDEI